MSLPVFSVADIRQIEADADASGYSFAAMMQDAGQLTAVQAAKMLEGIDAPRVTVLVGKGNNGGDGLVAAQHLTTLRTDIQVRAYLLEKREDDALLTAAAEQGVFISYAEDDHDGRVIRHMTASADLVIDALFGIGVQLPIRESAQRLLRNVRQALNERANARRTRPIIDPTAVGQIERPPKQSVLAVDCPSGVDCDTGEVDKLALKADVTLTFIAAKAGLLAFPAAEYVGKLLVAPLNMPENVNLTKRTQINLLDNEGAKQLLPVRPLNAHKGSFGRVLLVAGSADMPGAAGLAAKSAYRAGAGLVEVAAQPEVVNALQTHLLEPLWTPLPATNGYLMADALKRLTERLKDADSLVIGPGLGDPRQNGVIIQDALIHLRANYPALPVLLDADALNALSLLPDWANLLPPEAILTPHPGEMSRLLSVETTDVQKNRLATALKAAADWQTVVVLKGAHTIVAAPDGQAVISPFKTDALSKGGTGDVLAGLIGALRAQGLSAFDAASVGVYIHALAAIIATETPGYSGGLLAEELADALPLAFNRIANG